MEEQTYNDDNNYTIIELLLSKSHRLSLFVGTCLHLSRTLTGYAALQSYSTEFFKSVGIITEMSKYLTISMSAISVIATIATIPSIDRVGRRTLHLIGLIGMVFSLIMITVGLNFDSSHDEVIVAIFALLFMIFYVIGPGTVPWVATGEIFIQGPRGAATSICIFLNWTGGIIVSLIFPQFMNHAFNYSFLPFIICGTVLFIIGIIYFPETKKQVIKRFGSFISSTKCMEESYRIYKNLIKMQIEDSFRLEN